MSQVVLITGASKGIGAAIARTFAEKGYSLALNYCHSQTEVEQLKEALEKQYSVSICLVKADISKEEEVKKMVQLTVQQFGQIDVLVNNAGIAIDTLYQDKTVSNFRRTLDVNLIGTFLVSREVGDLMYQRKKGTMINISSTNGIDQGFPMSLDYDASKAGIISLTHNLAIQYAPYVRVNAVAPGWVKTEHEMEGLDQEFIDLESSKILLRRFAEPEEIAAVVFFLASSAASYINSEVIRVAGGA